ncbi:MAG: hypothetical protein RIQ68_1242, partial [Pseudomonadota bacterium]
MSHSDLRDITARASSAQLLAPNALREALSA